MAESKFLTKIYSEKRCHMMIGSNHYEGYLGKGVGEAFTRRFELRFDTFETSADEAYTKM